MKWKIGNTTLEVLPPVKRYMNAIERHLRVDRENRARIMTELAGDFESRREAGQSDKEIMTELGTPEEVAAQFNTALGVSGSISRWRWAFVVLAVLVVAVVLGPDLINRFAATQAESLGVIGGADGPTAIYVTAGPAAGISPWVFLPWLLGCAAAFLLPNWRVPHACKGYGPSLLLSGLGSLPFLLLAALFIGTCLPHFDELLYAIPLLLSLSAFCGALLSVVVFCWALWARRRAKKTAKQSNEKK
ncbi:MAG: DUF1700 domain-containing protein [Gemmiger sp.]|uniref:HAAS signaling domain-containing protein n=1 Tax=Gemmiger sp. TaxID=2049027 RepID=UPI002E78F75E|nr:DUF1700 domain-containing protein [Gemmiger sp.]MEE0710416.1 DUF1700 domain-containing protein [Gemmiger sp.]